MAVLYDAYNSTAGGVNPWAAYKFDDNNEWYAMVWNPDNAYNISSVKFLLKKTGDPGDITVALQATSAVVKDALPKGVDLVTGEISSGQVSTANYAWVSCDFSSAYALAASSSYSLVVKATGLGAANYYNWCGDTGGITPGEPSMTAAHMAYSNDGGSNWTAYNSVGPDDIDMSFETYGAGIAPTDKKYSKKWFALGNEELWYESTAGTMAEISDARGTISTANPLTIAEAFQKIFIANQSILKVFDSATIRLVTDELGTGSVSVPARKAILSGDTSGAGMVCDFVDAATGSAYVYGYQIGSTAFVSDDTVVDVDSTTSVSFSLITAPTDPPHYYNWTPYANDTTTYGSMPSSAYIVARYRGRVVLAGHPNYPHQWYMSKIGNPWDWIYGSTDPLTAVAGNNADAGELGDIIRALIPYGDDFLVFGCAHSIHLLDGDPAFSGTIDEIDSNTGIFSPWSWCKDGDGNLYFYGSNGLYKMSGGRSKPVNFNKAHLPLLCEKWAVNPSTHRVVLVFDIQRNAILISKTTLATGANEAYWYSIETEGFYPCSFPDECGVFCGNCYNADNPDYRASLYGSATGYINKFLDTAKNDDIGASDSAISSYVAMVEHLSDDEDNEGKATSATFVLAGGASGGDFRDSDNLICEFHIADDAETCLEDMRDGATAFLTIALVSAGRKPRIRTKIRGAYLGIKLINDVVDETWGINGIFMDVKSVGKI